MPRSTKCRIRGRTTQCWAQKALRGVLGGAGVEAGWRGSGICMVLCPSCREVSAPVTGSVAARSLAGALRLRLPVARAPPPAPPGLAFDLGQAEANAAERPSGLRPGAVGSAAG